MIDQIGGDFLQWLRGFYFVAKRGSVTQAALEMGRNQPTISHQIKCLEEEFGVTLFDRSSTKMELTPEGRLLLAKAISLFETVREMKSEIQEGELEQEGKIIIATTHAVVHFFLPTHVLQFRRTHPKVIFDIEGGGLEMILKKVEAAEADFGIASADNFPDTMVYHNLFETELKLVAPKKNAFFSSGQPTLKQISRAPFIFFPRSSTIVPFIERKFAEKHLKLNIVLVLNNFEDVKTYVALGLGVSILDGFTLTKKDEEDLAISPLGHFFPKRNYGLILRRRKYLSPAVKAFLHTMKPDIAFK